MPLPRSLLSVLSPKTAFAATTAGEKMPNLALLPICRADLESVREGDGVWCCGGAGIFVLMSLAAAPKKWQRRGGKYHAVCGRAIMVRNASRSVAAAAAAAAPTGAGLE